LYSHPELSPERFISFLVDSANTVPDTFLLKRSLMVSSPPYQPELAEFISNANFLKLLVTQKQGSSLLDGKAPFTS